jgi:spermidine synthase
VVALAFLVSGAAGLVYQVSWQRILALHSGVGIYSIAMIVGAFMAGLGLGSEVGGVLSPRVAPRIALRLFAAIELAIGAFGAVSCWLYYDVLYLQAAWLYDPPWRAGLLHFAGLFVPTFLMGMSLPFLVRATVLEARDAGRIVGLLYGINLLGAAVGSVLTPWWLVRTGGLREAAEFAAWCNVAAGLLALAAGALRGRVDEARASASTPSPSPEARDEHAFGLWLFLYAMSGFVALSLEILWFRLLEMAVKATAFTFGTLLGYYLLGSAIGCLAGAFLSRRLRRPLRLFLALQCAIVGWAALGVVALAHAGPGWPLFHWYHDYWRAGWFVLGRMWSPERFLYLYVALPLLLFAVPTVLMGLSFSTLQRAVHDDPHTSGRKVGMLQAANIAGCVAGSLLVGLVLFDHLGTVGTFRLLCGVGVGFALIGLRTEGRGFAAAAAALAALAVLLPHPDRIWSQLHALQPQEKAIVEEDASGVSALVERRAGRWEVYFNGRRHSWIPFGGVHTNLGAAPAMIHPDPAEVAIVGLGSGDTAWAAGARRATRSVTVFEIAAGQPRLLRRLAAERDIPGLRGFLQDPRLRIHIADGRLALEQEGRLYDVIEADALWPAAPYAGNLYSVEFFQQCMRRLKPGGILCTWAPTDRVYHSFTRAAPYILGTKDRTVLFGSHQPIPLDHAAWMARAASDEVRAYLGDEASGSLGKLLRGLRPMNVKRHAYGDELMNFDLFPRDEFATP